MQQPASATLSPITPEGFGPAQAAALLRRAGFGGTPAQADSLAEMGPQRAVDLLVNFEQVPDPDPATPDRFDGAIIREPTEAQRREIRQARLRRDEDALAQYRMEIERMQRADRAQASDLQRWWLARMIDSPRPLEEKMTLFWHGLFATSQRKVQNSYHLYLQNRVFRAHALGSFADLLHAMIRDPAMLAWLDNHTSRAQSPNENLAREIMELFTLGPGHYTERDIKEGARALTGHTFEGNEFVFRADWHDNNLKNILGARGRFNGDDFVALILRKPACAESLAHKIYRFFVNADTPESPADASNEAKAAISHLARDIRGSAYDLRPALKRLFLSEHFYEACARSTHIKSPIDLLVGAVRTLRAPARDPSALVYAIARMGQEIFFPPTVAGWSGGRAWINTATLLTRQNTLVYLLTGMTPQSAARRWRRPGTADDYDALGALPVFRTAETPAAMATGLCARLLAVHSPSGVGALAQWIADMFEIGIDERIPRAITQEEACATLIALGALPEYQLC